MTENNTTIDRRTYLKTTGIAATAGMAGFAGCLGNDSSNGSNGLLATRVTDQPGDIADFESCIVTIEGIWVKPGEPDDDDDEDDGDDDDGVEEQDEEDVDQSDERQYHEFDEPQEADLVQLQDGNTQLIDDREIETGDYQFLQLDVSSVDGTLEDGGDAEVDTPGNAPLQFKRAFEVRESQRTVFTADFTPVRRGQTGRYLLQPVARRTSVEYEDIEDDDDDEVDEDENDSPADNTENGGS